MIYFNTSKERIELAVKSIVYGNLIKVCKLEDDNSVLIQLIFKNGVELNHLLRLGISIYNVRISCNDEEQTLVTFLIYKS